MLLDGALKQIDAARHRIERLKEALASQSGEAEREEEALDTREEKGEDAHNVPEVRKEENEKEARAAPHLMEKGRPSKGEGGEEEVRCLQPFLFFLRVRD